jgi:NitT/TauT family transport system ATP-binding protein
MSVASRPDMALPADPDSGVVVDVRGAGKTYPDGTRALAPVHLAVSSREFVTLLGPSGCGKSTLLKMVAGLLAPSDGEVRLWREVQSAVTQTPGAAGRKLAFVFQDATLMPWSRVRGNVRLPLDLAGVPRGDADRRVDDALALVGLQGFDRHYPRQLSGGMQMRASIARALVMEPNLLLLDEPFGALDEITRTRLDADILDLWWRHSLTVMFVTHSIYEAVFLSTRVVVMAARPGRVLREVLIDEPFPRSEAFRVSQKFLSCCKELSGLLAEAAASGGADPLAGAPT